jgi:hypothetical protein
MAAVVLGSVNGAASSYAVDVCPVVCLHLLVQMNRRQTAGRTSSLLSYVNLMFRYHVMSIGPCRCTAAHVQLLTVTPINN